MSRDLGVSLFRTKYRLEWHHGFTRSEARKCTWLHKICIGERKKADILNRKNFLLKFIVLGCYAPSIFIILLPILSYIYRESSSVNFVHLSRIYIYFFRLNGLCPFRLGLFFYSRICPFFTRREVLSLTSAISFRVNNYQFFMGVKFVFCFVYLVFFPGFSSRPYVPSKRFLWTF